MIIAIAGRTVDSEGRVCSMGSGKSTVAETLIKEHRFTQIGLADPMRRFVQEVYQFSDDQVWGPSEARNALDERYPRAAHDFDADGKCRCCGAVSSGVHVPGPHSQPRMPQNPQCFLTARYALQTLGTEWSRNCDPLTWPRRLMQTALQLQEGGKYYDPKKGIQYLYDLSDVIQPRTNVVVCDVRYRNELDYIRHNGGHTVLVERPVDSLGDALNASHASEVDLNSVKIKEFSAYILNDGSLEDLALKVDQIFQELSR